MNKLNVFSGENSVLDFLNPDNNPMIPLIEIPKKLNSFYGDDVRIYAKLMNMLPLSNVKSLPAFNMLNNAKKKGELEDVKNLIENSSGNTVFSLAMIARLMGIQNTSAFVSNEASRSKIDLLRIFGVNVIINEEPICPDPKDETSGIYKAKRIGNRKSWFNAGQYENENNPKAHYRWTAKQIWEQLNKDIQIFCAGLGTTGTMTGCSEFFKKKNSSIKTVGIIRSPNNPIPGVRTKNLLNMIAFDWKDYVDFIEEIGTKESFEKSLELIRHGLVVGPSSGFALAGLLKFLGDLKRNGKLNDLRNKNGKINCVFICCDSPFLYMEDYFLHLEESKFPEVKNEELLLNKCNFDRNKINHDHSFDVPVEEVYEMIYSENKKKLWGLIRKGSEIKMKDQILVIDIRANSEFEHFHLLGSENMVLSNVIDNLKKYVKRMKGKKVIVVCNFGVKSKQIVKLLRNQGIEAYSLKGGLTEWSKLDLPRWKVEKCFKE